jgi:hypothetical protein
VEAPGKHDRLKSGDRGSKPVILLVTCFEMICRLKSMLMMLGEHR